MSRTETRALLTASILSLLSSLACSDGGGSELDGGSSGSSSSSSGSNGPASGAATSAGSAQGTAASSSGGLVINVGGSSSDGGSSNPGDGTPEVCDGIDNDSNGIVDDVDAGGDGVCDCLNIATIGHIGPWSNGGNIFASWLDARSPIGAVELADSEVTAEALKKFQIVVLLHAATSAIEHDGKTVPAQHAFSAAEASAFEQWVRSGGGVVSTIGYTYDEAAEVENVNKLLGTLGMGYSNSALGLSGNVKHWQTHPITDGISNIFTDNGVEPATTSGMTIATSDDDRVALQVKQVDHGRVAVWGDEWITYDSEWADVDGQQVELFWLNLLKWLSPPSECQVPIPPRVK